jgi:hypothetical protein
MSRLLLGRHFPAGLAWAVVIALPLVAVRSLRAQEPAYYMKDIRTGEMVPVQHGDRNTVRAVYWQVLYYRTGAPRTGRDNMWGSTTGKTADAVLASMKSSQDIERRSCSSRNKVVPCESSTYFNFLGPVAVVSSISPAAPAPDAAERAFDADRVDYDFERSLARFFSCGSGGVGDNSPCNEFLRKALHGAYCLTDFDDGPSANEIAARLASSNEWIDLGEASSQQALDRARRAAAAGDAVVAAQREPLHGHVALILPGPASRSVRKDGKPSAWGSLQIPRAAGMQLDNPKGIPTFIGRRLSSAWSSPIGVRLYARRAPCGPRRSR